MFIFYLVQLGLISLHIATYKDRFANMFFTFSITFACKKLLKSMEEKDKAGVVGLAGYALVLAQYVSYIAAVKESGTHNALNPELNLLEKGQVPLQDMIKNGLKELFK